MPSTCHTMTRPLTSPAATWRPEGWQATAVICRRWRMAEREGGRGEEEGEGERRREEEEARARRLEERERERREVMGSCGRRNRGGGENRVRWIEEEKVAGHSSHWKFPGREGRGKECHEGKKTHPHP